MTPSPVPQGAWTLHRWLPAGLLALFIALSAYAGFSTQGEDRAWALMAILMSSGLGLSIMLGLAQRVWRRNGELIEARSALQQETHRRLSAQADIKRLVTEDDLTGLANRRFFLDDLDYVLRQAGQHDQQVALIIIDLNHFQTLNNSLGHRFGDNLLTLVGQRLDGLSDEHTLVSHSSGDEFLIRYYPVTHLEQVFTLLDRLQQCFGQPFTLENESHPITASIGVALFPEGGDNADTLLRNADAALYRAKNEGGTSYAFFTEHMHLQASHRLALHRDLHRGLARDEFELHFQTQQDLATGQIGSVEALIRWRHPERGLLLPDTFMPAAMDTGLIRDLGRWVLAQACQQLHAWQDTDFRHLRIAVNLSAEELAQPDLVPYLAECLKRHGVPASKLEIELTEQSLIADLEHNQQQLARLTALGLPIVVDDFGTGYSSLSYLRRFPIHTLKIDRFFIQHVTDNHNDAVITRAVIHLAHNLGIQVVAEGVENAAQLTFLQAHRCDFAQGFHIGRPQPALELTA